jgi:glucosamine kinase
MSNDIFIGIDGGGSKSRAYIEDASGRLIGSATGGPSNIRLSTDVAWNSIYNAIHAALSKTKITLEDKNYNFHIGLGLAGTEVPADRERFLARSHPFKTILLESDAYAACLGAHNNKDGAIIIIGTGVNGYQVQNGKTVQVSGWGFPHDDIGGGAWLGLQAASLTLQWLDGRIESSPMLEDIHRHFNEDLIELVAYANAANSTQFAKLAPFVVQHIKTEDRYALQLIRSAAKAIDNVSAAMKKRAIDKNIILPVSLFGGIAPFLRPWLSEDLQKRLTERTHDASVGAVFMIKNLVDKTA